MTTNNTNTSGELSISGLPKTLTQNCYTYHKMAHKTTLQFCDLRQPKMKKFNMHNVLRVVAITKDYLAVQI